MITSVIIIYHIKLNTISTVLLWEGERKVNKQSIKLRFDIIRQVDTSLAKKMPKLMPTGLLRVKQINKRAKHESTLRMIRRMMSKNGFNR